MPAVTSLDWRATPFEKNAYPQDLIAVGGRLVGVGARPTGAAAWYSDDGGDTWARAQVSAKPPFKGAQSSLQLLAASGNTLVAIGDWQSDTAQSMPRVAVWRSNDHGSTWQETPRGILRGQVFDVVGTSSGFLALGYDFEHDASRLWTSSGGTAWRATTPIGLPNLFDEVHLVVTSKEILAVGAEPSNIGGMSAGIWRSTDGARWSPLLGGDSQHRGTVAGLATNGTGLRAVGSVWPRNGGQDDSTAAAWESADGKGWHLRVIDEAPRSQASAIASGDIGSVIVGGSRDGQTGTIWFIPAGASQPDSRKLDAFVHHVVAPPGRFVAIQDCGQRRDCQSQTILIGRPAGTAGSPAGSEAIPPG